MNFYFYHPLANTRNISQSYETDVNGLYFHRNPSLYLDQQQKIECSDDKIHLCFQCHSH